MLWCTNADILPFSCLMCSVSAADLGDFESTEKDVEHIIDNGLLLQEVSKWGLVRGRPKLYMLESNLQWHMHKKPFSLQGRSVCESPRGGPADIWVTFWVLMSIFLQWNAAHSKDHPRSTVSSLWKSPTRVTCWLVRGLLTYKSLNVYCANQHVRKIPFTSWCSILLTADKCKHPFRVHYSLWITIWFWLIGWYMINVKLGFSMGYILFYWA